MFLMLWFSYINIIGGKECVAVRVLLLIAHIVFVSLTLITKYVELLYIDMCPSFG